MTEHDDIEGFILLECAGSQLNLDNLQLIDPGIIDLHCDSEEDSDIVQQPEYLSDSDDSSIEPHVVTPPPKLKLKPLSVQIVDCFKFPWYFDNFTKEVIESNIAMSSTKDRLMNDGKYSAGMDYVNRSLVNSTHPVIKVDDDSSAIISAKGVCNTYKEVSQNDLKIKRHIEIKNVHPFVTKNANDSVKTLDRRVHKSIKNQSDNIKKNKKNPIKDVVSGKKIVNRLKRGDDNNRIDLAIRKALEQRNKTTIDLKKNIGLIGMKIQRLPNMFDNHRKANNEKATVKKIKKQKENKCIGRQTNMLNRINKICKEAEPKNVIDLNVEPLNLSITNNKTSTVEKNKSEQLDQVNTQFDKTHEIAKEIYRLAKSKNCNKTLICRSTLDDCNKKIDDKSSTPVNNEDLVMQNSETNKTGYSNVRQLHSPACIVMNDLSSKKSPSKKSMAVINLTASPEIDNPEKDNTIKLCESGNIYTKNSQASFNQSTTVLSNEKQSKLSVNILNIQAQRIQDLKRMKPTKQSSYNISASDLSSATLNKVIDDRSKQIQEAINVIRSTQNSRTLTIGTSQNLSAKSMVDINNPRSLIAEKQTTIKNVNVDKTSSLQTSATRIIKANEMAKIKSPSHVDNEPIAKSNDINQTSTSSLRADTKLCEKSINNETQKIAHTITVPTEAESTKKVKEKYPIQTIVSSPGDLSKYTKFDPTFNNNLHESISMSAKKPTQMQNNHSQATTGPLNVHNSMQAHTLHEMFPNMNTNLTQENTVLPQMVERSSRPLDTKIANNLKKTAEAICPDRYAAPMCMRYSGPDVRFLPQRVDPRQSLSRGQVVSQAYSPHGAHFAQTCMNYHQVPPLNIDWPGNRYTATLLPPPPTPPPIIPSRPANIQSHLQIADGSVIGRNSDGIIKRISITAPATEHKGKESKGGTVSVKYLNGNSTPLYDEPNINSGNATAINTKQEMKMELNTNTKKLKSPFLTKKQSYNSSSKAYNLVTIHENGNCLNDKQSYYAPSKGTLEKYAQNKIVYKIASAGCDTVPPVPENKFQITKKYFIGEIHNTKEKKVKKSKNNSEGTKQLNSAVEIVPVLQKNIVKTSLNKKKNISIPKVISNDSKLEKSYGDVRGTDAIGKIDIGSMLDCCNIPWEIKTNPFQNRTPNSPKKILEPMPETGITLPSKRPANDSNSTSQSLGPKYKPGPLSKKKQITNQEQNVPSTKYSAPVLPIPSYEKIISKNVYRNSTDNIKIIGSSNCSSKGISKKINEETLQKTKRISIDEYKKRTIENRVDGKRGIEIDRPVSTADSDLGYDSDCTIKL